MQRQTIEEWLKQFEPDMSSTNKIILKKRNAELTAYNALLRDIKDFLTNENTIYTCIEHIIENKIISYDWYKSLNFDDTDNVYLNFQLSFMYRVKDKMIKDGLYNKNYKEEDI